MRSNVETHISRMVGGDTAGLYDAQTYLTCVVGMCQRARQEALLADIAAIAFPSLSYLTTDGNGRRWRTSGGSEIALHSSQWLSVLVEIAAAVLTRRGMLHLRPDALQVMRAAIEHINQWHVDGYTARYVTAVSKTPEQTDENVDKALYCLNDRAIFMLQIGMTVAGVLRGRTDIQPWLTANGYSLTAGAMDLVRACAALLVARVSDGEIDAGYWRHYEDQRWAMYSGETPPMTCGSSDPGATRTWNVDAGTVSLDLDAGWDVSHARRFVAFCRVSQWARAAAIDFFTLPQAWPEALAHQLAQAIPSRMVVDGNRPRFTNYWSGRDGWYRVDFNPAVQCFGGYEPGGLSDALLVGGYPEWAREDEGFGRLVSRLYALAHSQSPIDQAHMTRYFPAARSWVLNDGAQVPMAAFYASLVH